jgi:nucleoside 2-deoxyribosyltransferase
MKTKIYLASALFTLAEIEYNKKLANKLQELGYEIFLPQEQCDGLTDPYSIYEKCIEGIRWCDFLVVNMEGTDVDSGTAFECGFATGINKPIIGLRTDFRQRGDNKGLNLMLSESAYSVLYEQDFNKLLAYIERMIIMYKDEKSKQEKLCYER